MKNAKTALKAIWAGSCMLILILDSRTALNAAREGITLCINTVIPSLFPFFVLSCLLTGYLDQFQFRFLRPLGVLCKMPRGSEPLMLLGLLGGYPAGARNIAQSHSTGSLTTQDARRLLGFCSNAGPAFIFGVAAGQFREKWVPWALWAVHIISAVLTGMLLSGKAKDHAKTYRGASLSLPQALDSALRTTARVCGWVMLFRILLDFLEKWLSFLFSNEAQIILSGLTELSIGCSSLGVIENTGTRFVICAVMLGFGGLCVLMQTVSVTGKLGLGAYIPGKLLHAALSFQLSYQLQYLILPSEARLVLPTGFILIFWVCLFIIKITVAIPGFMMYNHGNIRDLRSRLCFSVKIFQKPATTVPTAPAMKKG